MIKSKRKLYQVGIYVDGHGIFQSWQVIYACGWVRHTAYVTHGSQVLQSFNGPFALERAVRQGTRLANEYYYKDKTNDKKPYGLFGRLL